MKITEDVPKWAAEQGITENAAIEKGLEQKETEFNEAGAELYAKTWLQPPRSVEAFRVRGAHATRVLVSATRRSELRLYC
jgi:hypothetical protein